MRGKTRPVALAGAADRRCIKRGRPVEIQQRRQRQCDLIWRLGARVFFELIDEIDRHYQLGEELDLRLERHAELDPELLSVLGGDRFAPRPMPRLVAGGCR
jgi:hypothetical protein